MNARDEFKNMLQDALDETGADLEQTSDEIADYMAERSLHLSTITGEPGFGRAVHREALNVAMRAGLETSADAQAIDQRLFGMIAGALRIVALMLV